MSKQQEIKAPVKKKMSPREAAQLRRAEEEKRKRLIYLGAAAGVVVLLGAVLYSVFNTPPAPVIQGVEVFPNIQAGHTTAAVTYAQAPPVGGEHDARWVNCGSYDQSLRNENAVHSMEHGALWITYQPNLPTDQVSQLRNLARGQRYVLLSPYEGLSSPIVASAWGAQLKAETGNDPRLPNFISTYQNGPFTPERGAPCTGGMGTPLG